MTMTLEKLEQDIARIEEIGHRVNTEFAAGLAEVLEIANDGAGDAAIFGYLANLTVPLHNAYNFYLRDEDATDIRRDSFFTVIQEFVESRPDAVLPEFEPEGKDAD